MRGYIRGALIGSIIGAAASMMMLNYYEPRTARSMMKRGQGALRIMAKRAKHLGNW